MQLLQTKHTIPYEYKKKLDPSPSLHYAKLKENKVES